MRAFETSKKMLDPKVRHFAVFDSAFFSNMPQKAFMYGLPYSAYAQNGIRRYGFHGMSHSYLLSAVSARLKASASQLNVITVHLGSGSSVAAISCGQPVDCSMGLTPVSGVLMATRTGDIDPTAIFHCKDLVGDDKSDASIEQFLNTECGFKGLCGETDIREVEKRMHSGSPTSPPCTILLSSAVRVGDEKARLAYDMFCYSILKYIGAYYVALGSVDAIVFSGGIGEHSATVRSDIIGGLSKPLGIQIASRANQRHAELISEAVSRISVFVIPTNEELQMAREIVPMLGK